MKAVIFNSGLGSRLGELTKEKPKCMLKLYNGETIFERQIRILSECGIENFVVTTGPYKEQLWDVAKEYSQLNITFVENEEYKNTNYIVSMKKAEKFIDDSVLLLHGDLVFNKGLIKKILSDNRKSLCLFNEEKSLPEKDFKGRFLNNKLQEVSVAIFDQDCYAFQPLYKLSKRNVEKWKEEVSRVVESGRVKTYAETALNTILDTMEISGFSYKNDYIEEIDNKEDYDKVSGEIQFFDYREQEIIRDSYTQYLKENIQPSDEVFVVSSKRMREEIESKLKGKQLTFFNDFSANPKYEEIKRGVKLFKEKRYQKMISLGGGSSIDVAKCIKLFSTLNNENDFLQKKYRYNPIKHIAVPTTAGTGSESTQLAVMYYHGEKCSIEHGSILPDVAVLDYTMLKTLSDYQKKATLLDALCQGIESFWARGATEESKQYAKKCIILILENYKEYLQNNSISAERILLAANYSGKAINISRTTAPHAMSYKLTTLYGISHGYAVAMSLIPCWEMLYEKSSSNKKLQDILVALSEVMGCTNILESIRKIQNIIKTLQVPQINVQEKDIDKLVATVSIERLSNNPIIFNENEIRKLYENLYFG
ncbi:iron-containing alcohol dehydrogenase [Faecalimonas sp.]